MASLAGLETQRLTHVAILMAWVRTPAYTTSLRGAEAFRLSMKELIEKAKPRRGASRSLIPLRGGGRRGRPKVRRRSALRHGQLVRRAGRRPKRGHRYE